MISSPRLPEISMRRLERRYWPKKLRDCAGKRDISPMRCLENFYCSYRNNRDQCLISFRVRKLHLKFTGRMVDSRKAYYASPDDVTISNMPPIEKFFPFLWKRNVMKRGWTSPKEIQVILTDFIDRVFKSVHDTVAPTARCADKPVKHFLVRCEVVW